MIAQTVGLKLGDFVHTFGDAHIYSNHLEQVNLQLSREPKPYPTMKIKNIKNSVFDYNYEDFILEGYDSWPAIKGTVAI
jgi:thymidylate synthase